jgi:membrane protein
MARLRDLSPTFKRVGFIGFCKRVWHQCSEDGVFTWGSALAYSWLFAIFPFIVFLLSLVPYFPVQAKNWIENDLGEVLNKALPADAYRTVWQEYLMKETSGQTRLQKLVNSPPRGFVSVIGLLLAVWGASGGINMTINALDKCYDIDKPRPFYRSRSLAVFLTFIVASLMLAVAVLLPVATTVRSWVQNYLAHMDSPMTIPRWGLFLFEIARYLLALICMFTALAVLYYFGPAVKQRFRWITPGAIFSVIVWLVLGFLFRLYVDTLGKGKYEQTYGPVGGVVILLLFFYIDAVVLLIGAEINSEIDYVALDLQPGARDFRGEPWQQREVHAAHA